MTEETKGTDVQPGKEEAKAVAAPAVAVPPAAVPASAAKPADSTDKK